MKEPEVVEGQIVQHVVNGKKIRLTPLNLKNYAKAEDLIADAGNVIKDGPKDEKMAALIGRILDSHGLTFMKMMTGEDFTRDWVEENMSQPLLLQMLRESLIISGLPDFFLNWGKAKPDPTPTPPPASE